MFGTVAGFIFASTPSLGVVSCGHIRPATASTTEIGDVQVNPDIKLRRMVMHPSNPKGTVLFLHGLPETLYAWKRIAESQSSDYEVHAFTGRDTVNPLDPTRTASRMRLKTTLRCSKTISEHSVSICQIW